MTKPRLSLCMVVRDCAETLEPLLESVCPYAEEMIFILGGESTDATPEIAHRYGRIVVPIDWKWDWASARNEALKHVTGQYWLWLDGDDALEGVENIPQILDMMDGRRWGRCDLTYLYDFDEHGNCLVAHTRERIMRTELKWHWEDRVHETCHADEQHLIGYSDLVKVRHCRNADGSSSERNLPILLEMLEQEPKPRTILHTAHAYYSLAQFEAAQRYYEMYCEQPEDDLNHWNALCMAVRCCFRRSDWLGVQSFSLAALGVLNQFKDPYIYLAHAAWTLEQSPDKALGWLKAAEGMDEAPMAVFRLPLDYTINTWDVEHRCYARLGQFDKALEVCDRAVEIMPTQEWRDAAGFYREALRASRSVAAAFVLCDHLVRRGDAIRAQALLDLLPQTAKTDERLKLLRNRLGTYLLADREPEKVYEELADITYQAQAEQMKRVKWYVRRLRAREAKRVLEVGCHIGDVSRALARAGFEVTGIDINGRAVEEAQRLAAKERLDGRLRFVHGDIGTVRERFDAVLLAEILEHLRPQRQVDLLMAAEQLAPVILGSVPAELLSYGPGLFEEYKGVKGHLFEFGQDDLEALMLTDPARRIVNCHKITDEACVAGSPAGTSGFGQRLFEYDFDHGRGLGISIFLGEGLEYWTPDSIDETGLGGSETWAVELSEELASRGHRVVVYAMEDGVYNGVVYRHYLKFRPDDEREALVVSRLPQVAEEEPNAHQLWLMCHDTSYGDWFTEEVADRFTGVIVLSEWHRGHWLDNYPSCSGEKVRVVGDGLRAITAKPQRRQPHRFVWSSSPDRGLHDVLALWPFIREMWPDAELHIHYGWEYLDAFAQKGLLRPDRLHYKAEVLRQARQPGVFLDGRLGQSRLMVEMAKAQFWLYPSLQPDNSDWFETYCITALEAQAAGCFPVTRRVGALPERIPWDDCFVDSWARDDILARLHWFDSLAPAKARAFRTKMQRWALRREHSWKAVADQWEEMLNAHIRVTEA